MKRLKSIFILSALMALAACGGGGEEKTADRPKMQLQNQRQTEVAEEAPAEEPATADAEADAMSNKGIGPVSSLELGEVDQALASEGEALFTANCTACHKTDKRYIGPEVAGVTERRTPEWIMNMILNPTEMIQKDPLAKQLVGEYNGAVMANQNLTEEQARAILEYFRTL